MTSSAAAWSDARDCARRILVKYIEQTRIRLWRAICFVVVRRGRSIRFEGSDSVTCFSATALNHNGATFAGMGVDAADYDNDGWPDIFVTALSLRYN